MSECADGVLIGNMGFRTKEVVFVIILLYTTVKVTVVVTPLPTAVVVMMQGVASMTPQPWPMLDQVPIERGLLALKGPDHTYYR